MKEQSEIKIAAEYIQQGKIVAFPTETVYGLGANAFNPISVSRIYELKQRPSFDPLIVHIASIEMLQEVVSQVDDRVYQLAEKFWPGPLTIVLPKNNRIPDIVTAGLPTVGVRMPNHPIALALIRESNCPIAAPSANKFGRVSPTTAEHVRKQLPGIDFIIDGGRTQVGIESTIIQLHEKGFEILRHGIITCEEIESVIPNHYSNESEKQITAPGMLKSHYQPQKPLFIIDENFTENIDKSKSVLLSFTGKYATNYKWVENMCNNNDLKEYAINLFAVLHKYEDMKEIDYIIAEPVPEKGIGLAIMDRLRKASFKI